jgi:hypothetical protein
MSWQHPWAETPLNMERYGMYTRLRNSATVIAITLATILCSSCSKSAEAGSALEQWAGVRFWMTTQEATRTVRLPYASTPGQDDSTVPYAPTYLDITGGTAANKHVDYGKVYFDRTNERVALIMLRFSQSEPTCSDNSRLHVQRFMDELTAAINRIAGPTKPGVPDRMPDGTDAIDYEWVASAIKTRAHFNFDCNQVAAVLTADPINPRVRNE